MLSSYSPRVKINARTIPTVTMRGIAYLDFKKPCLCPSPTNGSLIDFQNNKIESYFSMLEILTGDEKWIRLFEIGKLLSEIWFCQLILTVFLTIEKQTNYTFPVSQIPDTYIADN